MYLPTELSFKLGWQSRALIRDDFMYVIVVARSIKLTNITEIIEMPSENVKNVRQRRLRNQLVQVLTGQASARVSCLTPDKFSDCRLHNALVDWA